MLNKKVTKAIFPVAGFGVRFLPATKACPKEMMPICDKPLIQYAVEEAVQAGMTELIFITGRNKRAIEDHFDKSYELESELLKRGKDQFLEIVQNIVPATVNCIYIRQPDALGLGHAVKCASALISTDEAFAVILADDLIYNDNNNQLKAMLDLHYQTNSSIIGVQPVIQEQTHLYGIVEPKTSITNNRYQSISTIIEKPQQTKSNLAVIGRYILTSKIFDKINTNNQNHSEIQLTDAISDLLTEQEVYYYTITGKRYDCGSKIGYMQAIVDYALRHPKLGAEFRQYLNGIKQ